MSRGASSLREEQEQAPRVFDLLDTPASSESDAVPPEVRISRRRPHLRLRNILLPALLAGDIVAVAGALGAASFIRFQLGWFELTPSIDPSGSHLLAAALWTSAFFAAAGVNRLYDQDTLGPDSNILSRVMRSTIEAVALLAVLALFTKTFDVSRSWFGMVALFTLAGVAGGRALTTFFIRRWQERGKLRRPAILLSKSGQSWPRDFVQRCTEFDIVAHLDPASLSRYLQATLRQFRAGTHGDWERAAIILRAAEFEEDELWQIVLDAGRAGSSVYLHSSVRSVGRDRLTVRDLSGSTMVKIAPPRLEGLPALEKRAFDLFTSGLGLLFFSPVFLIIAAAVLVTSGRPVFYGQDRVGREGTIFRMWKFRSMRNDAETRTGAVWAKKDDPRVTPVGRFLRRSSLDELPQLVNVLLGHMSLVGPRPERPVFVDRFSKELASYQYRHRIRPGVTGWAQAHGLRGNTPLDQRVDFDNWYIEHWSLGLDAKALARTAKELVRGEHAY